MDSVGLAALSNKITSTDYSNLQCNATMEKAWEALVRAEFKF